MSEAETRALATRLHGQAIRMLRMMRREDETADLSGPRLSALSVIVFSGPLSLSELAKAEQVRPPTMSRIVDALVAGGLVQRDAGINDRRSVRLSATEAGRELMARGQESRVRALAARMSRLAGSELRALSRGVDILEGLLK